MFLFIRLPIFVFFCFLSFLFWFIYSFLLELWIRIYFQVNWRREHSGWPKSYFYLPPLTSPDHRRNLSTLNLRFCAGGGLLFKFLIYLQFKQVLTFIRFTMRNFGCMSGNTKSRFISRLGSDAKHVHWNQYYAKERSAPTLVLNNIATI